MPTPKPEPKYPGTQAELYAICKLGWASYAENVADFTAFKVFYDAAYGTTALAAVNAAQAMPDDQARGAAPEMLRIALTQAAAAATLKWKALRAYIKSAYDPEMVKAQEEAAGYGYYDTATHGDWEDMDQMLLSGSNFITANAADLTADGGMPAAFTAAYTTARTTFTTLYGQFKDSEQDSTEGTDVKVTANNAIYDNLMAMFDDGQIIYDDNAAKRDRFIYAQVKSLVTPGGGGGGGEIILGTVQNTVAPMMIGNAGALPAGTQKIRMTGIQNGPLEFGLSLDGLTAIGNTTTLSAPASTTYLIADFASTGTMMVVRNQNATLIGEYKVEFLG